MSNLNDIFFTPAANQELTYGIREIARTQKVPMRRIKELLGEVHDVLLDICYE